MTSPNNDNRRGPDRRAGPRRALPITSFSPEIMTLLLQGAVQDLTFTLPYNRAVILRQRLYRLRRALFDAHHPSAPLVQNVFIRLLPKGAPTPGWVPTDRTHSTEVCISNRSDEDRKLLEHLGLELTSHDFGRPPDLPLEGEPDRDPLAPDEPDREPDPDPSAPLDSQLTTIERIFGTKLKD